MTAAIEDVPFLNYRLRWRAEETRPGKHRARQSGSGGDFHGVRPFWQVPDARRIDIRRSIVDPFGEVMVRETEQRSAICVAVAVDLSRSMAPGDGRRLVHEAARVARSAARAALRAGDSFALIGFDTAVREEMCLAPTRARAAARAATEALDRFNPEGRGAEGMTQIAAHLPNKRALVLLVSDFLMPVEIVRAGLAALGRHDVAPVVVRSDRAEMLPEFGLLRLRDAETGQGRLLLMRPGLKRRWAAAEAAREGALRALFRQHGRAAFTARGTIDLDALSDHLMDC